jgi:hypothetical protein
LLTLPATDVTISVIVSWLQVMAAMASHGGDGYLAMESQMTREALVMVAMAAG